MAKDAPDIGWFSCWALAVALLLPPTPASAFEGVWHGKYTCMQGLTGVTLTITRDTIGHSWNARFCFCAIAENPNLPTGEFELDAPMVPGETVVSLTPRRWIRQPAGWMMVPVELSQSPDGSIAGRIGAPGCSTLTVEPVRDAAQPRCQCRAVPVS